MIVGLVFGVMSVVILNNYSQSPIQNAYDCPDIHEIKLEVRKVLQCCSTNEDG
ncbi:uncharacterized protein METZ01_LOCUS331706, partial [marine metagenome]